MSANEYRHRVWLAKMWLCIRSECPKVPRIWRNEKHVSTKNSNSCY